MSAYSNQSYYNENSNPFADTSAGSYAPPPVPSRPGAGSPSNGAGAGSAYALAPAPAPAPGGGAHTYGAPAYGAPAYGAPVYGGAAYGGPPYAGAQYGQDGFGQNMNNPNPNPNGGQPPVAAASEPADGNKCRDKVCLFLFLAHIVAFVIVGAVFISKRSTGSWRASMEDGKFLILILVGAGVATVFSVIYMFLIQLLKGKVVYFSMVAQIIFYLGASIICFIFENYTPAVIALILVPVCALYFYCVRDRIPFTEALLHTSVTGIRTYWGVFITAFFMCVLSVGWLIWWILTFAYTLAYFFFHEDSVSLIMFLYILSLYWTTQVLRNIAHTTTAGAIGTWWFQPEANSGVTFGAFKRASTTSLGSIALGSFIVALIQSLRFLAGGGRNNRSLAACMLVFIIGIIERIMRYFNMYAYTQVALYGKDFITSAKDTMDMFEAKGLTMLINDNLTEIVCFIASIITAILTSICVALPASIAIEGTNVTNSLFYFFMFFVVGYCVSAVMFVQIQSAVCTTFVVWAQDPDTMQARRPFEYTELMNARKTREAQVQPQNAQPQGQPQQQQQQQPGGF